MKPIALIQITSGETIQNLLPIPAIRPQQIVNLTTSKFAASFTLKISRFAQAHIKNKIRVPS